MFSELSETNSWIFATSILLLGTTPSMPASESEDIISAALSPVTPSTAIPNTKNLDAINVIITATSAAIAPTCLSIPLIKVFAFFLNTISKYSPDRADRERSSFSCFESKLKVSPSSAVFISVSAIPLLLTELRKDAVFLPRTRAEQLNLFISTPRRTRSLPQCNIRCRCMKLCADFLRIPRVCACLLKILPIYRRNILSSLLPRQLQHAVRKV